MAQNLRGIVEECAKMRRMQDHETSLLSSFGPTLAAWQRTHGRHSFSWQRYSTPYERWLSEVMLQQTRTTTVEGYFRKFLEEFPTVKDLAAASEDEVQALWAGLGYYSRARNLHKAAQVVAQRGGRFPETAEGLAELPGVGPSTAGAIAAFCYGERAVMCDGNAKRVLARVCAVPGAIGERAFEKAVWEAAESLLPSSDDMAAYTQGLMDVGAEICRKKNPLCEECPVRALCRARAEGTMELYPGPRTKRERPVREATLFFTYADDGVLLRKKTEKGVWHGLWLPPLSESSYDAGEALGLSSNSILWQRVGEAWPHDFTHYRLIVTPVVVRLSPGVRLEGWRSVSRQERAQFGMPAPVAQYWPTADAVEARLSASAYGSRCAAPGSGGE